LSVTELGETAQVASVGPPVQANVSGWLNPPTGFSVRVKVADWPAVMDMLLGDEEIEKSTPAPPSVTVCGLPGALSEIAS
jgi:hypothetical protein